MKLMKVELKQVTEDEKEILRNLLEKYSYEFSQWDKSDMNDLGLYGYKYLDYYWTEEKRWAYFILAEDKLAGFVMINGLPVVEEKDTDYQIAEFFVMHKYRHLGVGRQAFFKVLGNYKGRWQLKLHPANTASVHFWNRVISDYTNGQYALVEAYPQTDYNDGTPADVLFFNS